MRYYAQASDKINPSTVNFAGLDRNATYTLCLYSQKATNATSPETTFIVNGSSFTLTNTNASTSVVSGVNYIQINGVHSDASSNLNFSFLPGPNASTGALNGIQLFQTSGTQLFIVPEPACTTLLGIGGLLATARSFFQRKQEDKSGAA
jgi:hypothetical protein